MLGGKTKLIDYYLMLRRGNLYDEFTRRINLNYVGAIHLCPYESENAHGWRGRLSNSPVLDDGLSGGGKL